MSNTCQRHGRYNCFDSTCRTQASTSNAGQIAIDGSGIAIGIGGGMTIDPGDGSLGMSIGGFNLDFDGN